LNSDETDHDTDRDGRPNQSDIDADADGIIDLLEGQATGMTIIPLGTDADHDGLDDAFEAAGGVNAVDTDADGIADYLDIDSDGDAINDNYELMDPNNYTPPSSKDENCNGLDDAYDSKYSGVFLDGTYDGDETAIPDYRELPGSCTDLNLLPSQFLMDGLAKTMKDTAEKVLKSKRKLARSGDCNFISDRAYKAKLNRVQELYISIWTNTWNIPATHYPCAESAPLSNCSYVDTTQAKNDNAASVQEIYKIARRTGAQCSSKRIKGFYRTLNTIRDQFAAEAGGVPNPILYCPE
jgi:hypothetical protein